MKVLVTGSQGYIGTVLMQLLQQRGHEAVGLDSDLYRYCTFGDNVPRNTFINKDVRDLEEADLQGCEAVLHLAGLSNDPLGNLNPDLTFEINHKASVRLAELAKAAGVRRFVFSSSCSNYGAGGEQMLNENSQFHPVTPYGKSKVLVEQDVSQMADDSFSPTFLRNATAYGVSPRLRFDLVLNNLVAWAFTTGKIMMKSDGSPWRPIVHIEDISLAFAAVIEAPLELVHNKAFNVGVTSDNLQIRDIAGIVGKTVPGCTVAFADGASPDKRCYRVDCSLLPKVLPAFEPQWNAVLGASELYEAYKTHGVTLEEFEGPRYQRIAHIKMLLASGELDDNLRWKN
jgi:nucleoside-diphosphate-sugar epimerase